MQMFSLETLPTQRLQPFLINLFPYFFPIISFKKIGCISTSFIEKLYVEQELIIIFNDFFYKKCLILLAYIYVSQLTT